MLYAAACFPALPESIITLISRLPGHYTNALIAPHFQLFTISDDADSSLRRPLYCYPQQQRRAFEYRREPTGRLCDEMKRDIEINDVSAGCLWGAARLLKRY